MLGVEGKGLIAAILIAPSMIITIAEFGVRNAAAYHIGRETWPVHKIVETTLTTALFTSVAGGLLCFAWLWFTWEDGYTPLAVLLAVLVIPGAIAHTYIGGIFLGLQRIADYAVSNWGPGVGKFLFTLGLVALLGFGIEGAVGAVSLSMAAVGLIMLYKLARLTKIRIAWNPEIARQMTAIGSSYAFVYFMMVLVYRANIFLVQEFGGITQLGYYSLGSNLAELLWQVPAVMTAIVFTRSAAAKDEAQFSRKVALLARMTFLAGLVAAFIAWLLAPIVVPLVYGDEFAHSADILVVLLPGALSMVVFKILRQDLSGRGRPWAAAWIIAPMLAATVIGGSYLIPRYGAMGAAFCMSTVYILGTLGFIVLYARVTGISVAEIVLYRKSDFTTLIKAFTKQYRKSRGIKTPVFRSTRIVPTPVFRSSRAAVLSEELPLAQV